MPTAWGRFGESGLEAEPDVTVRIQACVMLIVPPFMLQLGWVHVRVLSTREGQWGLFGDLWVCIIVNWPLMEQVVPSPAAPFPVPKCPYS